MQDERRTPATQGRILVAGLLFAAVGYAISPVQQDPETQSYPAIPGGATSDSNGSMIAVTGMDVTGASILYLVDTESKQLAIYQANGGGKSTQGVRLVGARRIDLDLQLLGFNDKTKDGDTDLLYSVLEAQFQEQGLLPAKR